MTHEPNRDDGTAEPPDGPEHDHTLPNAWEVPCFADPRHAFAAPESLVWQPPPGFDMEEHQKRVRETGRQQRYIFEED